MKTLKKKSVTSNQTTGTVSLIFKATDGLKTSTFRLNLIRSWGTVNVQSKEYWSKLPLSYSNGHKYFYCYLLLIMVLVYCTFYIFITIFHSAVGGSDWYKMELKSWLFLSLSFTSTGSVNRPGPVPAFLRNPPGIPPHLDMKHFLQFPLESPHPASIGLFHNFKAVSSHTSTWTLEWAIFFFFFNWRDKQLVFGSAVNLAAPCYKQIKKTKYWCD